MKGTYKVDKKGSVVTRRITPSTIVRQTKIKKDREALKKKSPEEQAEILAKVATAHQFHPRGRPMWAVPAPGLTSNEPATQPYTSERAKMIGRLAGLTARMGASYVSPFLAAPAQELASYGAQNLSQYFGWGMNSPKLLLPNHPAHYRPNSDFSKGTPLNPIYRSLEMVNAF
jgi:hypothetical protein